MDKYPSLKKNTSKPECTWAMSESFLTTDLIIRPNLTGRNTVLI